MIALPTARRTPAPGRTGRLLRSAEAHNQSFLKHAAIVLAIGSIYFASRAIILRQGARVVHDSRRPRIVKWNMFGGARWPLVTSEDYEECIGAKKHLVLGLSSHGPK
jgi:hypothetical protein